MLPEPYEPDVVRTLRQYRELLEARELDAMARMAQSWLAIERRLDADILTLALEMQRRIDAGEVITKQMIWRSDRYKIIKGKLADEVKAWNRASLIPQIETEQRAFGQLGINAARDAIYASYQPLAAPLFPVLNPDAVETMVGYLGNGSPLNTLLKQDYPDALEGLSNALLQGIGRGLGPATVAREMANGMGMGLERAMLIARTEINRTYRNANIKAYRASDVVSGFMRLVKKGTACMACFVDWKVPILTSKGFVPIARIKVGDLVLTHTGRFKPVTKLIRQSVPSASIVTIRADLGSGKKNNNLVVTEEHPFLTQRGWIKAIDLTLEDFIAVPTKPCDVCGKPILFIYKGNHSCSKSCTGILGAAGLHKNKESHKAAIDNMTKTHRKMLKNGTHPFQNPEIRKRATRNALRANSLLVSSRTEGKLADAFALVGLKPETQYPIFSRYQEKQNRTYYYYADFAFPEERVVVEADGEPWHTWDEKRIEHDKIRQQKIESQGWTVLRYTGSEIGADSLAIAREVKAILLNHSGNYGSQFVQIKSIEYGIRKPPSPEFKVTRYNLEVEEDHSYVAKFATVHNCLMLDGQRFEVEDDFSDHPRGKCVAVPYLKDAPTPTWQTGPEWFETLTPDQQREKMGGDKYDAWKDGQFKLADLAKMQHSDVWGDSPRVATLRELAK